MNLNEVRAVVTGGVSGLGLAVAEHLVKSGGKVALFDINDAAFLPHDYHLTQYAIGDLFA